MPVQFKTLQTAKTVPIISILGPPKHGKTICSLTSSAKCDPTFKTPQMLDDIAVVSFDNGGLDGAQAMGVDLKYWLDLSGSASTTLAALDKDLDDAMVAVADLVKTGKVSIIVVDPVSTLDVAWKAFLTRTYEKFTLLDQLLAKHRRFLMEKLMPLPAIKVLTFHTKVTGAAMDDAKRQALGLDAGDTQTFDVSGWEAPGLYRKQSSLTIPIRKVDGKGGAPSTFHLYPRGIGGIEAGGRYPAIEALDKMPANLQELFKLMALKP